MHNGRPVISKEFQKMGIYHELLECSEKSYNAMFTNKELLHNIIFLNFNLKWLYLVTLTNFLLLSSYTYSLAFDLEMEFNVYLKLARLCCQIVILIDILSMTMHKYNKETASTRPIPPVHLVFILLDVCSIPTMILQRAFFANPIFFHYARIAFGFIRSYRLFKYLYMSSKSGDEYTAVKMFGTYGLLCGFTVHISTCLLQSICTDCKFGERRQSNWYGEIGMQFYFNISKTATPFHIYLMGVFNILGIFTRVGYSGAAPNNIRESIFVSILSLIAMYLVSGAFLSAFVSVRIANQRMQHEFFSKLVIIKNNLERDNISTVLKNVILNYYKFFWEKEKGIKQSSLFQALPASIRYQVTFDKYWQALEQSYIMRDESEEFRREVSAYMYTEIMIQGETIYELGERKNAMVYIAQGSVQLLSRHDGESPILSLGAGSLLGEVSLMCSYRCKVMVRAESYCVIYYLNKYDFWRLRSVRCNRELSTSIYNKFRQKFDEAKRALHEIKKENERFCFLASVKKKLITVRDIRLVKDSGIVEKVLMRTNDSFSSMYILSELETVLNYDDVFAKTTWPWIFHPRSQAIVIWDMGLLAIIITNAIILPYSMIIGKEEDNGGRLMLLLLPVTSFFYISDVALKLFVGVETEDVLYTKISDIVRYRIADFVFLLDIAAALPLYLLSEHYLNINMLLKVGQVVKFMVNVEKTLVFNVVVVRIVKYISFILYTTYLLAVLFIWISCISIEMDECHNIPWIRVLGLEKWIPHKVMVHSMSRILMILSQTDANLITSLEEVILTAVTAVVGVVLFLYILSEFTASMVANEKLKQWYTELVYNIEIYMQANDTAKEMRQRMRSFLESQWLIDKGLKKHELYKDLPTDLYKELQIEKYLFTCSNMALFQDIDLNLLQSLVQYCSPLFLPPNELIIHEGDYAGYIFIIEKGFCEVLRVEKDVEVIGAPSYFGEIDMLLDKPARHAVRTVTYVSLITISRKRVAEFLNAYPEVKSHFSTVIDQLKNSILVHRVYGVKSSMDNVLEENEKIKSWFVFPKLKRHPLAKDYERPFTQIGSFRFLRLILLRRTFIPDGEFIVRWEVFRAILAIFSALMGPTMFIFLSMTKYIHNIFYCFDVIYIVDIYLRFHGSYYNKKGLLVTHPLKTAKRYLTSSFLVEFISTLPFNGVLFTNRNVKLMCIVNFLKVLQLYRLPGALFIFKRNSFRQNSLLENCLLFIPLMIIVLNTTTCLYLVLVNNFYVNQDGYLYLSRIIYSNTYNYTAVIDEYRVTIYRLTTFTFTLGLIYNRGSGLDKFMVFAACILIGYLMLSYALMFLINHQANISFHLTAIQNNTRSLVKYMIRESIPPQLQKDTLQYFEIFWRRSNQRIQSEVLKRCHSGLTQDWVLYMYGETLSKVSVFQEMGHTFYKKIGSHMKTLNFLSGTTIVKINDVVDTVYILNHGFVRVEGPDGALVDYLQQGSMFGNIDNVPMSRSMITISATGPVDLICIEGTLLYNLLKTHPIVINRLNKHILIKCLAYISAEEVLHKLDIRKDDLRELHNSDILDIEYRTWKFDVIFKLMTSIYIRTFLMLCSYFSTIIALTLVAFDIPLRIYSYALDGIHLIKIVFTLFTPYVNNVGEVIKEKKLIWKRYVRSFAFMFDILGILPFEIIGYIIPNNHYFRLELLMTNRVFRLFAVCQYFSKAYANLDVNMILVKLTTILLYTFLLVHSMACLVYFISCPNELNCTSTWMKFTKDSYYVWKFNEMYGYNGTVSGCDSSDHYYTCSVLYAVSLITLTGFPFPRPMRNTHTDVIVVFIVVILCRIIIATLMGHLFGLLRHVSYEVMMHNYATNELKKFLRQSAISPYLTKRIMKYVKHLWMWEKAVQLPTLMTEAPPYLSEQIKIAAYGHHLNENWIFNNCHPDFLRQLVRQLNVENYFGDDIICQQGDLNETMYFIHKGTVDVIRADGIIDTIVDVLTELDTFGVYQGLYPCIPHTHSYQAKSVTIVLTIKRSDWIHLLRFYPASKFTIFETLSDIAAVYDQKIS